MVVDNPLDPKNTVVSFRYGHEGAVSWSTGKTGDGSISGKVVDPAAGQDPVVCNDAGGTRTCTPGNYCTDSSILSWDTVEGLTQRKLACFFRPDKPT